MDNIRNTNNLTSFVVNASPKNEVCYFATMFNTASIQDLLIVSLPKLFTDVTIKTVAEIGSGIKESDISEYCVTSKGRHWLDIPSEKLNLTAGYHIYKIVFADNITSIGCTLYFAYNIQDDNPEKPYDYMDPIREAQEEAKSDSEDEEGD